MTNDHQDLVIERTLDAPRDLVWKAWSDPEHLRQWWAPRPYETVECEIDLRPGGRFYTRMKGPDDFDQPGTGCFLEVVPGERIVWTTALASEYRPALPDNCGGLLFTAIITLEEAPNGRTLYRAVAMHPSQAERDRHAEMGFEEGWGTVTEQLGEVARRLGETV